MQHRSAILRCFICLSFFTAWLDLSAQHSLRKPVFFCAEKIPLENILDSLEQKLDIYFSYNTELISHHCEVSCCFHGETLEYALNILTDSLHIGFLERGKQIAFYQLSRQPILYGNSSKALIELKGIIKDEKTGKPVPFATISLFNYPLGVISNKDGFFSIHLPASLGDSTLNVSCIGYYDYSFRHTATDTGDITIMLKQAKISISEAIVRPDDPVRLIDAANRSVQANYSDKPAYLTAFFRETSWKDKSCISLSESVVFIYKSSYINPYDNDQVKLFKGRKQQDTIELSRLNYKVEGGLFNSLLLDIAKNKISFLDPEYRQDYLYNFEGFTQYNGNEVYVISFDQKEQVTIPLFKGLLYLDLKTLAFVGANFELSPRAIRYARQMLVKKSPFKYQVKPIRAQYAVQYRHTRSGWDLDHVRMNLEIKARPRNALSNSVYKTVSELIITGKDTTGVRRYKNNEVSKSSDIFVNQIKDMDPYFWEGFNVLQPESDLKEAVNRIQKKMCPQIPFDR